MRRYREINEWFKMHGVLEAEGVKGLKKRVCLGVRALPVVGVSLKSNSPSPRSRIRAESSVFQQVLLQPTLKLYPTRSNTSDSPSPLGHEHLKHCLA